MISNEINCLQGGVCKVHKVHKVYKVYKVCKVCKDFLERVAGFQPFSMLAL